MKCRREEGLSWMKCKTFEDAISYLFRDKTLQQKHTLYTVAFRLEFGEHNRHARRLSGVNALENVVGNCPEVQRKWVLGEKIYS